MQQHQAKDTVSNGVLPVCRINIHNLMVYSVLLIDKSRIKNLSFPVFSVFGHLGKQNFSRKQVGYVFTVTVFLADAQFTVFLKNGGGRFWCVSLFSWWTYKQTHKPFI